MKYVVCDYNIVDKDFIGIFKLYSIKEQIVKFKYYRVV